MKKKIFTFLLLLFLSSCGYEARYSIKNRDDYNFSITGLSLTGDRQTNLKIKQGLNIYTNISEDKTFVLKISSKSEKIIKAKNVAGDATNYENIITIDAEVFMNGKFKNNFTIEESFNYDNNSDKFALREYEREIKNNLAETATEKLIFKLASFQ